MDERKILIAWIDCALAILADLGPEIWWVTLHRPEGFEACDSWVSVQEQFPTGGPRWLLYHRDNEGHWSRAA